MVPPSELRHWRVAGGVVLSGSGGLLLVENQRRNGSIDWSTPGGVVDDGETFVSALTREVREETGLSVAAWTGPVYRVEVLAPELGFFLQVEAHVANAFTGEILVEDPDEIVLSALFLDRDEADERLASAARFVREPLLEHLDGAASKNQLFEYRIDGNGSDREVVRLA